MGAVRRQESPFRRFQQNTTKRDHDNHEHGGDGDDFVNQVACEPGVIIIIAGDTAGTTHFGLDRTPGDFDDVRPSTKDAHSPANELDANALAQLCSVMFPQS